MALFRNRRNQYVQGVYLKDEQQRVAEDHQREMDAARQTQARLRVIGAETETLRAYARKQQRQ